MKIVNMIRKIIPTIIAAITGRERYLPEHADFKRGVFVHNVFRLWERIAWRGFGKGGVGDVITKEASVSFQVDEDGKITVHREFYTLEALCAEGERIIVEAWKRLWKIDPVLGFAPQPAYLVLGILGLKITLSGDMNGIMAPFFGLGISFGTSNIDNHLGGGGASVSMTVSGSNVLGVVHVSNQTTATTQTPTWNGSNCTQSQGEVSGGANRFVTQWFVLGATTGTVSCPRSGGTNRISAIAAYYTGVRQTSQPDAEASSTGSSTTITGTVTMVNANSLGIMGISQSGGAPVASTNAVRVNAETDADSALYDSTVTPTVSPGSFSMVVTKNNGAWGQIITTFAPNIITQALNATVTASASVRKQMSKTLTATVTASVSYIKSVSKRLNVTVTATASFIRSVTKRLNATVTATATVTAMRVYLVALTSLVTATATITKIPRKVFNVTVTATATIRRSVTKTLTATVTATATIRKGMQMALNATATAAATITKIPRKVLSATVTAATSIDKRLIKILMATVTASVTMIHSRAVMMYVTTTATATITKIPRKVLSVVVTAIAKIKVAFWKIKYPPHNDDEDYTIKY